MTPTFDTVVTLVEQLSPVDQARLVVLLAERLHDALRVEPPSVDSDEPAFWHLHTAAAEWADREAVGVALHRASNGAQIKTQAMLTRWFGAPLREEDALELAMSEAIAERNLH